VNNQAVYCATDKEIYDLLMSSKQRLTTGVLLHFASERGIFYSPLESREQLADFVSLLPHDFGSLEVLRGQRESQARAEKVTSVALTTSIAVDEIKQACATYRDSVAVDEKVTTHFDGAEKYVLRVGYTELEYAKTRLLQRRAKEAEIEFIVRGDETTIRMPATPKAREIVAALKNSLDGLKKTDIPSESIELTDLNSDARTQFFTYLINGIDGFHLQNVTSVRVDSSLYTREASANDLDGEDEDGTSTDDARSDTEAKEQMLSVVENVALRGQSLLNAPEYQELKRKGFFITSINWRAKQDESPYASYAFEAGFDEPGEAKGFRYFVRGAYRRVKDDYTRSLRPLTKDERTSALVLLERAARGFMHNLQQASNDDVVLTPKDGDAK
jgi:hypothetical protein